MLGIDYASIFGRSTICACADTCSMPTGSQSASVCQTDCMYACMLSCLQLEEHEGLEHMSCRLQLWATRKPNQASVARICQWQNAICPGIGMSLMPSTCIAGYWVPYALMRRTTTNSNVKLHHSRCVLCEGRDGSGLLHWPVSILYMQV